MSIPTKAGVSYTIRFVGTKRDFEAGVKGTVRFAGEPEQGIGARDYPLYSDAIGVTLKSAVRESRNVVGFWGPNLTARASGFDIILA